jgi:hypothetical protein
MRLLSPSGLDRLFQGPFVDSESILSRASSEDAPSLSGSDVTSLGYDSDDNQSVASLSSAAAPRTRLQWEFHGLTLWLEFEEFDLDLSKAIDFAVQMYGTEKIPLPHTTAIYGMTHLTQEQAKAKLAVVPEVLSGWKNVLDPPKGLTCDIAEEGKPGQVCSIAWAELTYPTNEAHEAAIDALYELFEMPNQRQGVWTPHISLAYDNPEDSVLNIHDTYTYVSQHPTLMRSRRITAISLWNTAGKMADWQCLDRVSLPSLPEAN